MNSLQWMEPTISAAFSTTASAWAVSASLYILIKSILASRLDFSIYSSLSFCVKVNLVLAASALARALAASKMTLELVKECEERFLE